MSQPAKFTVIRLSNGQTLRFSWDNVVGHWSGWELLSGSGYTTTEVVWLRSGRGVKWWPCTGQPSFGLEDFGAIRIPEGMALSAEEAMDWLIARGEALPEDLERLAAASDAGAVPPEPQPTIARTKPSLVTAFDNVRKRDVAIDVTHAEQYDLPEEGQDWDGLDGTWTYMVYRTLFRLRDGRWFLIEERFHREVDHSLGKEVRGVPDSEAADLLISSGVMPPQDIAHYVEDRIIAPGPDGRGSSRPEATPEPAGTKRSRDSRDQVQASTPQAMPPGGSHQPVGQEMLSCADLAERFKVNAEALRKRLERWMRTHQDDWVEVSDRRPNDPKYLFRLAVVLPIIHELQASGHLSGGRPSK